MTGQGKNEIDMQLARSLKELAAKKPIEKITIKEITDKAGVIRPTFYNHFQDKYELMEWILDAELLEPSRPLIEANMLTEAMTLLFTKVEKDKVFYSRAVRMDGAVTFDHIVETCVERFLKDIYQGKASAAGKMLESNSSRHKWLTSDLAAAYYAQSFSFIAFRWVQQGMQASPREVAEAYVFIMSHSMMDLFA